MNSRIEVLIDLKPEIKSSQLFNDIESVEDFLEILDDLCQKVSTVRLAHP